MDAYDQIKYWAGMLSEAMDDKAARGETDREGEG